MKRPIAIGLSPNTQKDDVRLATRLLCMPWRYVHGSSAKELERWFRNYFATSWAISFVNARSALYSIFHCLGIGQHDEVILQAFTCVAVPNAIIATGARPVYVDIDDTLNLDPTKIEKKITKKTKAILVQHTFAIPADMDKIMAIAEKYTLPIIEDCAHTIGGKYKGKKLGTLGKAACYSFGRDKAFSSVFGGMATTSDKELGQKLRTYQKQKNFPSFPWIVQQVFYPIISAFILNYYYVLYLGKILHFFLRRTRFFSFPVSVQEKRGDFSSREVKRFPNALATLALSQVKKLETYNKKRNDVAKFYQQHLEHHGFTIPFDNIPLLRFPLLVSNKKKLKAHFAKKGIYIGDWYNSAIDPVGVNLEKVYYKMGSCPKAEKIAESIVNLPTYPTMTMQDAEMVVRALKGYKND